MARVITQRRTIKKSLIPQPIATPNILRKLPPELREKVFIPCMKADVTILPPPHDNSHDFRRRIKTTPALLIALCVDKTLYEEALALHYKMNTMVLSATTLPSIRERLSPSIPSMIRHLTLNLDGAVAMEPPFAPYLSDYSIAKTMYVGQHPWITHFWHYIDRYIKGIGKSKGKTKASIFHSLTNLETLSIQARDYNYQRLLDFLTKFHKAALPTLKEINVILLLDILRGMGGLSHDPTMKEKIDACLRKKGWRVNNERDLVGGSWGEFPWSEEAGFVQPVRYRWSFVEGKTCDFVNGDDEWVVDRSED